MESAVLLNTYNTESPGGGDSPHTSQMSPMVTTPTPSHVVPVEATSTSTTVAQGGDGHRRNLITCISPKASPSIASSTRTRRVEAGTLHRYRPTTFGIIFETEPYWLLALHSLFVQSVVCFNRNSLHSPMNRSSLLSGFETSTHLLTTLTKFQDRFSLYNRTLQKLGLQHLIFTSDPEFLHDVDLILVSGSVSFYNALIDMVKSKHVIFINDTHYSKRTLPPSSVPIRRIRHTDVGGPTSYVALCAAMNMKLHPNSYNLQRVINHFLDYSIPPSRRTSTFPHPLSEHQRLPVPALLSPIEFTTSFSCIGKGIRVLTASELGLMFGLPSHTLSTLTLSSVPIPPVQILDAILRPDLTNLTTLPSSAHTMLEIPIVHPPRFTYFPQFNKFLSNSWASITADEAADKAAKADDASPVFRHWYDRITGLFPLAEPLIKPLQLENF